MKKPRRHEADGASGIRYAGRRYHCIPGSPRACPPFVWKLSRQGREVNMFSANAMPTTFVDHDDDRIEIASTELSLHDAIELHATLLRCARGAVHPYSWSKDTAPFFDVDAGNYLVAGPLARLDR